MLVVAIVGGAALPLLFGILLDALKTGETAAPADFRIAYLIFIPCYLYILFYACIGHKIGRNQKNTLSK
jgi:fucose permease